MQPKYAKSGQVKNMFLSHTKSILLFTVVFLILCEGLEGSFFILGMRLPCTILKCTWQRSDDDIW